MNFREASDIARMNPGAVVTRNEFGGFIVRNPDGTLLGAIDVEVDPAQSGLSEINALRQVCMRLYEEIKEAKQLLHAYESRESQLYNELLSLREDRQKLRVSASGAHSEIHGLQQKLTALQSENAFLRAKVGKVSDAEWTRIAEIERVQLEEDVSRRRAERRSISCTCSGQVENCARCYGSGEYVIDGFGNRV